MASEADSPAIGIDLGTTNSCVAVFQNGQVQIIENDHGNRTTPSCVVFEESQRLIGDAAMNMMAVNPTNTVCGVKRLIGRRFDDPVVQSDLQHFPFTVINDGGKPKIQVEYKGETKTFFPEEIAAMVLFKMKETAETHLGESVSSAVVSVPAYFNDTQRRATKVAANIAGLNVQLINEPTAAALAYGYRFNKDGKKRIVLIFDLGGGTLDVSLLTIENGSFLVRSTSGNSHLGGEDFNSRLVRHFIDEFKRKYKKDVSNDKRALSSLQSACERAKRCLSSTNQASIAIDSFYEGIDFYSSISRAHFEELNEDLFEATIDLVDKTIGDAKMLMADIDEVVLVGGSTRIPKIRNLLQEFFNGKELSKTINPDEAVAQGAAIQAAILNGDSSEIIQDLLLHDVAPFTIGSWSGSAMDGIIQRNSVIPIQVTKFYLTSKDNQTAFAPFRIYEVESPDDVSRNSNRLGSFKLNGMPAVPKDSKFDVTFNIQEDGIFYMTAVSKGFWSNLTITCDENEFSEEEMERMIADAERFRQDDLEQEKRATARNDLESFCSDIKSKIERVYHPQKEVLVDMIEQTIQWLENGPLASVEVMDTQKQAIERLLNTILSDPRVSLVEEVPRSVSVGREIHPNNVAQAPSGMGGRNEQRRTSSGGGRSKYCLYTVD